MAAGVPAERADVLHAIYDRITVAGRNIAFCQAHSVGVCPRIRVGTARKGCSGAPDRCWARDYNLRDPDRGAGRVAGSGAAAGVRKRAPARATERELVVVARSEER